MKIKHPEWLELEIDNQTLYGYNQEWYTTSFRKTRGCGPTAAAMLLLYLNVREAKPLSYESHSISSIAEVLEDVWTFVTPGWLFGLNSTEKFRKGMKALFENYGLSWKCHRLSITASRAKRKSLSHVVEFLKEGIESDCPIAFLNLHKGQATTLESWHWIVLVSLSYDVEHNSYMATCYDAGHIVTFDVGLWLETSRFGGGFVYVTVGSNYDKELEDD